MPSDGFVNVARTRGRFWRRIGACVSKTAKRGTSRGGGCSYMPCAVTFAHPSRHDHKQKWPRPRRGLRGIMPRPGTCSWGRASRSTTGNGRCTTPSGVSRDEGAASLGGPFFSGLRDQPAALRVPDFGPIPDRLPQGRGIPAKAIGRTRASLPRLCCSAILRPGGNLRRARLKRIPQFHVAVRAVADGTFTFELFALSAEPRKVPGESDRYATPADAARAGYAAIAARRL